MRCHRVAVVVWCPGVQGLVYPFQHVGFAYLMGRFENGSVTAKSSSE